MGRGVLRCAKLTTKSNVREYGAKWHREQKKMKTKKKKKRGLVGWQAFV